MVKGNIIPRNGDHTEKKLKGTRRGHGPKGPIYLKQASQVSEKNFTRVSIK